MLKTLTKKELTDFLLKHISAKEAQTLFDEEIDGEVFLNLKEEDLKEIGLKLGTRKKLMKIIYDTQREIKKEDSVSCLTPPSSPPSQPKQKKDGKHSPTGAQQLQVFKINTENLEKTNDVVKRKQTINTVTSKDDADEKLKSKQGNQPAFQTHSNSVQNRDLALFDSNNFEKRPVMMYAEDFRYIFSQLLQQQYSPNGYSDGSFSSRPQPHRSPPFNSCGIVSELPPQQWNSSGYCGISRSSRQPKVSLQRSGVNQPRSGLNQPVNVLSGIGPRYTERLNDRGNIYTVADLLEAAPRDEEAFIDYMNYEFDVFKHHARQCFRSLNDFF